MKAILTMAPKLLAPVVHRSDDAHVDLSLIRSRAVCVDARTRFVNSVRGQVKSAGHRLLKCSTESFGKRCDELPEALQASLKPLMDIIDELSKTIRGYDKAIDDCAKTSHPDAQRLRAIPGIGPLTSLAFVLILEDPTRAKNSRATGAFAGLTSRQRQSGGSDPNLGNT